MTWKKPFDLVKNRIDKYKKRIKETVTEPAKPDETKIGEKLADALNRFSRVFTISGDVDTLVDSIQGHINICGTDYSNMGYNHGKIGARDFQIRKQTEAHATLITGRVSAALSGQVQAHAFIIKEKTDDLERLKTEHERCLEDKKEQQHQAINDSKQYNRFNAWVYLISGLAMILADIAVSINLVAFFGVGNPKAKATFWEKITNLELFFFSLGIALCTVFIKIFYDEYINTKLGQTQLSFKQLTDKGVTIASIKKEFVIKLIVKGVIFAGLLVLLYYLAKYRTYFTVNNEFSLLTKMKDRQHLSNISEITDVILNSFIGITVVIPVISGIALSGGLKIFANRRARKEAVAEEEKARLRCDAVETELKNLTYKQKDIEQYNNEWSDKPQKILLTASFFAHNYEQGFRVGYRENHGNDLYKLVEEFRNEVIQQAFTNRLKLQ